MLFFCLPKRVLNQNGVDEVASWLNLKRFLIDFGDMKEKTVEMVVIWNFYLSYSIALEVNKTASKEIIDFFGEDIYLGTLEDSFKYNSLSIEEKLKINNKLEQDMESEYKKI